MRVGALVSALALVIAGRLAADSVEAPDAGVVRVDVLVADRSGRAPGTLTAADFTVLEDGAPRPVTAVQFVNARGGAGGSGEVPPVRSSADEQVAAMDADARLVAIFLDEYHVSPGDAVSRSREVLSRIVAALGPRDLILVVKPLDSLVTLRATHDRQAALDALAHFAGRKGDYTPQSTFEKNFIASDPLRIDAARRQVVTSALNALAVHLGALNTRRKTLVFVSDGFDGLRKRRGQEALPTIDTMLRSAGRGHVSIYPLAPGALAAGPGVPNPAGEPDGSSLARAALQELAAETSGSAMFAPAEQAAWIDRVVGDASHYYLVDFAAAHGQDVGAFRPIEVRVARPGLDVRARKGYWTANADERLAARLVAEAAAPRPPPEPPLHASTLVRPWFGMARAADGRLRVRFVWEAAGRVPGDRTRAQPPAVVSMRAVKDGTTVFEGLVRPTTGTVPERVDGPPDSAMFDVTPGRMRVQLTVRDEASRALDIDIRDVLVGTMAGQVALGTAEVFRVRTAHDFNAIVGAADAAPAAARDFSRAERLIVRVPAYAAGGAATVTARLLARGTTPLVDLPVEPGPSADSYQLDLPLANLANGEYAIEWVVSADGARAREAVPFRVTP